MKRKYFGAVGMVFASAALFIVAIELLWVPGLAINSIETFVNHHRYPAERLEIDNYAITRISAVEPTLSNLITPERMMDINPDAVSSQGVDYSMLGKRRSVPAPAPAPVIVRKAKKRKVYTPFEYQVAMTYISDEHRYVVIDNKFYREGAKLPDDAVVMEISASAVRISRKDDARWVSIKSTGRSETRADDVSRFVPGSGASDSRPASMKKEPGQPRQRFDMTKINRKPASVTR